MVVADTTFVIDVLAGDEGALRKLDELVGRSEALWLPAVALHELEYGAALHRNPKRERERIREVESAMPVVPFDAAQARLAGEMEAELELSRGASADAGPEVSATSRREGRDLLIRLPFTVRAHR
ncbi:MAG: PIN domain-containing protein [Candidatus Thermoplasmatota archaeon]